MISYYCSAKVNVRTARSLTLEEHEHVYVCDEAEELVENHPVFFEQTANKFFGSWSVRGMGAIWYADRAYFMSATFDHYQRILLRQVWNIHEAEIVAYQNLATVSSGTETLDFELSSIVRATEKELVAAMIEFVTVKFHDHPFIVFTAQPD